MEGSSGVNSLANSSSSGGPSRADKGRDGTDESREARATKPRRNVVHVACLVCRRLRIKCDGRRPTCQPCARRYEDCAYDVEANTTRSNALKRKNEDLARDNAQLRQLYAFLRDRPLVEADEIFRRIRSTPDPLDVLRHVVTADLLMSHGGSAAPLPNTPTQTRLQPSGVQAQRHEYGAVDGNAPASVATTRGTMPTQDGQ